MTKTIIFLVVVFSASVFGSNSIIAIVGDKIISTNQLDFYTSPNMSKKDKLGILNKIIDENIENQKIIQFDIKPNTDLIKSKLIQVAKTKSLSIEEFVATADYKLTLEKIKYQVTKLALKQFIIEEEIKNNNLIADAADYEKIYSDWLEKVKQKIFIEIYEEKLK